MSKESTDGKRLQRVDGLSLDEDSRILTAQGGVCAICQNPPRTRKLAVDHDHSLRYYASMVFKGDDGMWYSQYSIDPSVGYSKKRSEVVKYLKKYLKRQSIRGLLCPSCNRGLKFFRDFPRNLSRASDYIERYKNSGSAIYRS